MERTPPKPVENYTNPALVCLFVNMLWIFGVIWAAYGFWAVACLGWVINHLITRLELHRARQA